MSTEMLDELMLRANALTDEEKLRLADHLINSVAEAASASSSDAAEKQSNPVKPDRERKREQAWLSKHGSKYAGQWVALDGDVLVSHGPDGRRVLADARRAGIIVPFIVRVDSPDELPFGGW